MVYYHIVLSFTLLLFLFFCLLPLLFLLTSNVLVWAFLYSAKVLLRKKWWTLCHCYIFSNIVSFRCALLNVHLPLLYSFLYFCHKWWSQAAEWTETLCRVHAFRQAFNGFSLSWRPFSCLFHPSLFNVSIVNVHMIGWIKLQRWN